MRPVQAGKTERFQRFRNAVVCLKHELFDQLFGIPAFPADDIHGLSFAVEQDHRFAVFQFHHAAFTAVFRENPVKFVHFRQHRVNVAVFVVIYARFPVSKQGVDLVVYAAHGASDEGFENFRTHTPSVGSECDFRGEGVFVRSRVQGTRAVREGFRQHRHHFVGEINACAAFARFVFGRRILPDIVRHIRDMHTENPVSAVAFERNGVVEVFCSGTVDRENEFVPQIHAVFNRSNFFRRNFIRVTENRFREFRTDAV